MPSYLSPGVYIEEVPSAVQSIAGVGTHTIGFIGVIEDDLTYPEYIADSLYQERVQAAYLEAYGKDDDYTTKNIQQRLTAANNAQSATAAKLAPLQTALGKASTDFDKATRAKSNLAADANSADVDKALNTAQDALNAAQSALDDAKAKDEEASKTVSSAVALANTSEDSRLSAARQNARAVALAKVPRYELTPLMIDVPVAQAKLCTNFSEYQDRFGTWSAYTPAVAAAAGNAPIVLSGHQMLSHAVYGAFLNGASRVFVAYVRPGSIQEDLQTVLDNFESIESISIVAFPGASYDKDVATKLVAHCEKCKYRFAILDAPPNPLDAQGRLDLQQLTYDSTASALPSRSKHAAIYFPYLEVVDPALQMQQANLDVIPSKYKGLVHVPPSGAVAGIYARTDDTRGVWKAPANASVLGARNVQYYIGRSAQEGLNPQGVNCIRTLNGDITVWGARTLGGDLNSEWRYVSVRRTFLFIAKSIDEGTQWVVFEPNDMSLWGKVRRNVGAFLTTVWRDGALFGATPEEAFYVKCDAENNPLDSREVGRLVVEVGIAIVRPAEFVIFRITQSAGKSA